MRFDAEIAALKAERDQLREIHIDQSEQIQRLRAALEWYANEASWEYDPGGQFYYPADKDHGDIARRALRETAL